MPNYTVYHLHSDLSNPTTTIDSATKYHQYIQLAKSLGMSSLGFSEHGSVFEWYHKKSAIEKAGMKYIHGTELYVTKALDDKVRDNYHVVLIAKNYEGFKEINRLITKANTRKDNHFYYNPRISFEELCNTSDNILATSSCLGGILATKDEEFYNQALEFFIANKHRCWLEIQHHNVEEQVSHNRKLYDLSIKHNIPLIAGSDTHSLNKELAEARLILQRAKNIHFDNEDAWDTVFKSYDEFVEAFRVQNSLPMDIILDAIENTNRMANMIESFTLDKSPKYPKLYDDSEAEFKRRINEAYKNHEYVKKHDINLIKQRVQEEIEVYKQTETIDYMIFQHYLRQWEKENGIFCGYGRGSVTGSMIAYILGITEMDSIRFDLNFFRFLNPHRITLVDIDSDYDDVGREKLKTFLFSHKNMYLAEIVTFNTIAKKGAIRDVARALAIDLAKVNEICENIETKESEYRKEYPEMFKYVDLLQGVIVSIGTHPAGVCVSPIDLAENVGLCSLSTTEYPVTCLNMKELEELMFVKLDLLGLDNVGVINETCKMVGIERLTPDNTDLEDMKVWESIREDTTGIFQWESETAEAYLRKLLSNETIQKIKEKIPDLKMMKLFSFGNGLIRPACASYRDKVAMGEFYDNGLEVLNSFLQNTLGNCTMQEDIMMFLVKFCGYSMAESDTVRRCVDGDTLVTLSNGNLKRIKDFKVGDRVVSFNECGVSEAKDVTNVFDNGMATTYKVTTIHGKEIVATKDHKVLTQDGYKKIIDLTKNDFIMTANKIYADKDNLRPNQRLSSEEMFLIGMLIGDGSISEHTKVEKTINYSPAFINSEMELIEKFKHCIINRIRSKDNGEVSCEFNISKQEGKTVDYIYRITVKSPIQNKSLINLLDKYDLRHHSANKYIHNDLMSYPIGDKILNLLAGLFNTDGGCYKSYIDYSTTSLVLALQIKNLLLKFGIYSYIGVRKVTDYNYELYRVYISQRESLTNFAKYILPHMIGEKRSRFECVINDNISNEATYNFLLPNKCGEEIERNVKLYNKSLNDIGIKIGYDSNCFALKQNENGITDIKAKKIISEVYAPYTYWLLMSDLVPLKIKEIELIGEKHVYDIEVKDNHNYIANDLIVHNCIGKKLNTEQLLPEIRQRFIEYTSTHHNIDKSECEKIIEPFLQVILDASSYGFSWNHSDAYSCIGYVCGYLRYYYPLEFVTASLNIFKDNEEKRINILEYAKKNGIKILPIKFGKSSSMYTMNKENNSIYEGVSSVKFCNVQMGEELYEMAQNKEYKHFLDLLLDITSCNTKQRDILIKLGFFDMFGKNGKLLNFVKYFDLFLEMRQIKKEKYNNLELPENFINDISKSTDKMYKDIDWKTLLYRVWDSLEDINIPIHEQMQYELEYLGYIKLKMPNLTDNYKVITDIGTKYKNPVLTLYKLNDGTLERIKIKEHIFKENNMKIWDIIKIIEIVEEGKWKKDENNKWIQSKTEKEPFIKRFSFVK